MSIDHPQQIKRSRLAPGEEPVEPFRDTTVQERQSAAPATTEPETTSQQLEVVVVDIKLPFWSVVRIIVYVVLGAVPASALIALFFLSALGVLKMWR
jgi:hypothetical protein